VRVHVEPVKRQSPKTDPLITTNPFSHPVHMPYVPHVLGLAGSLGAGILYWVHASQQRSSSRVLTRHSGGGGSGSGAGQGGGGVGGCHHRCVEGLGHEQLQGRKGEARGRGELAHLQGRIGGGGRCS
jgi:hypothetical protein